MAVPKEIIKRNDGVPIKELSTFLINNNYTKIKDTREVRKLIFSWARKYNIINNELILNVKYNDQIKRRNLEYRQRQKELKDKKGFVNTPLNKSHIFMMIHNNNKLSKTQQCKINGVSYSGYRKWVDRGAKLIEPKYDPVILEEIKRIYYKYNVIYGVERIRAT